MKFDYQPRLDGRLVTLRPLLAKDFKALREAASDPLIWDLLPRSERHKAEIFQKFFEESLSLSSTLIVTIPETDKIIGSSRFARFDPEKSEVEIGWTFLAREYWGKGFNTELKSLMIEHAFNFVDSVFFVAASSNLRSCKAIEKLGATKEEELDWPPGASLQDPSILYRLFKKGGGRARSADNGKII